MAVLKETPIAKRDIEEIIQQISDDNSDAADRFLVRLYDRYQHLALNDEMGRVRPEFGRDVRSLPFERHYLIMYRSIQGGVEFSVSSMAREISKRCSERSR
jgi:plasmid stabilization system protein ParE